MLNNNLILTWPVINEACVGKKSKWLQIYKETKHESSFKKTYFLKTANVFTYVTTNFHFAPIWHLQSRRLLYLSSSIPILFLFISDIKHVSTPRFISIQAFFSINFFKHWFKHWAIKKNSKFYTELLNFFIDGVK